MGGPPIPCPMQHGVMAGSDSPDLLNVEFLVGGPGRLCPWAELDGSNRAVKWYWGKQPECLQNISYMNPNILRLAMESSFKAVCAQYGIMLVLYDDKPALYCAVCGKYGNESHFNQDHFKKCTRSGFSQVVRPGIDPKSKKECTSSLLDFYEEEVTFPANWGIDFGDEWYHVVQQLGKQSERIGVANMSPSNDDQTRVLSKIVAEQSKSVDDLGNTIMCMLNGIDEKIKGVVKEVEVLHLKVDALYYRSDAAQQMPMEFKACGRTGNTSSACWKGQIQESNSWRCSGKGDPDGQMQDSNSWRSICKGCPDGHIQDLCSWRNSGKGSADGQMQDSNCWRTSGKGCPDGQMQDSSSWRNNVKGCADGHMQESNSWRSNGKGNPDGQMQDASNWRGSYKGYSDGQMQDSNSWRSSGKGGADDRGSSSWYSNGKGMSSNKGHWQ